MTLIIIIIVAAIVMGTYLEHQNLKQMTYIKNPFHDLSLDELSTAYVNFTHSEDTEAVEWVIEAFCLKLKLDINFNNQLKINQIRMIRKLTQKEKRISITLWIINIILLIYLINHYNE